MNATVSASATTPTPARSKQEGSAGRGPSGGAVTGRKSRASASASREAQQRAAAILEVLAGVRTPTAAAQALGVSLPRYYLLEERALHGLVQACEAQPRGRVVSAESQRARLERECARWQQECTRQQALVRAAQRSIGLAAAPPPAAGKEAGRKRRPRKPVARALKAAAALRRPAEPAEATEVSTAVPASG